MIQQSDVQGKRNPIPLNSAGERIGTVGIPLDTSKVRGIVLSEKTDAPSTIVQSDEETIKMAEHFEVGEVGGYISNENKGEMYGLQAVLNID
ncbi:hypothetical protein AMS59_20750 [Lysinibacillus sp. FJAT-14745]|uniref:hypothetical protein n=1 Tax=Lysinibacillus sp. FJAT-14745 TaxID=1704289 RepID=UPI0006AB880D|nr:hypothetical protein [Lysinibacillus sp. FJAT-14745]KOP70255.1 hypothetical protein AMS59_20750 [Lysinibacillus sp. FJAT-14745]